MIILHLDWLKEFLDEVNENGVPILATVIAVVFVIVVIGAFVWCYRKAKQLKGRKNNSVYTMVPFSRPPNVAAAMPNEAEKNVDIIYKRIRDHEQQNHHYSYASFPGAETKQSLKEVCAFYFFPYEFCEV